MVTSDFVQGASDFVRGLRMILCKDTSDFLQGTRH